MSVFSGGSGTRLDPYLISTVQDLKDIDSVTAEGFANPWFRQTNDIDLSGEADWNSINLQGSYLGMGYEITNLTSTTGGLFQTTRHGYTWHVVIRDANINATGIDNVGILCNYRTGAKTKWILIINSSITVHGVYTPGDPEDPEDDGEWTGGANIGGVCGYTNRLLANSGIINTFVEGRKHIGGIVGNLDSSFINGSLMACYTAENTISLQTLEEGEQETDDLCRYLGGLAGRVRYNVENASEVRKNRIQYNYTSVNISGNQFDSGDALIGLYIEDVGPEYVIIDHNYYDSSKSSSSKIFAIGQTNSQIRAPMTGDHVFTSGTFSYWRMADVPPVPVDEPITVGWATYYAHENIFNGYPFQPPLVEIKYSYGGTTIYHNDVLQIENFADDSTSKYITMAPRNADWNTRFMNIKYMAGVDIRFVGINGTIPINLLLFKGTTIDNSEFFNFELNDFYGEEQNTITFEEPSRDIYTPLDFFNIRYNPTGTYTLKNDLDFSGFELPWYHIDNTWETGWASSVKRTPIEYSETQERRSTEARTNYGIEGTFRPIHGFYNYYINFHFGTNNLNFQGEGHLLQNMHLDVGLYEAAGIVRYGHNVTIENFKITDLNIICPLSAAGIAQFAHNATIKDIEILSSNIDGSGSWLWAAPNLPSAGLVAETAGDFVIEKCGVRGEIKGYHKAGGLVGESLGGEMHNCYFQGHLKSDHTAGLIAEMDDETFVSDSYAATSHDYKVSARPLSIGTYANKALWGCYFDYEKANLGHPNEITRADTERPRATVQMQYPHDSMNTPGEVGHEYDDIELLVRTWEYYWEQTSLATEEIWEPGLIYHVGDIVEHPAGGLKYRCITRHYSSEEGTFHQTFPWTFTTDDILWGYRWSDILGIYGYPVFAGIPPHDEWPPEIEWETGIIYLSRFWKQRTPDERWRYSER